MKGVLNRGLLVALLLSISLNIYFLSSTPNEPARNSSQASNPLVTDSHSPISNSKKTKQHQVNQDKSKLAIIAFNRRRFDDALELYDELTRENENKAAQLRDKWFVQVKAWIKDEQLPYATGFIESALHYQPYAKDFLELNALLLLAQNNPLEAISTYIEIHQNSFELTEQDQFASKIESIADDLLQQYSEAQRWSDAIELLLTLATEFPHKDRYLLRLAQAYIEQQEYENALAILRQFEHDPDYQRQVTELLQQIANAQSEITAIPLTRIGNHFLVSGQFEPNQSVKLMIDTGASMSVITQRHFEQLANWLYPTYIRDSEFSTAGGIVNAPIYQFAQFEIGGFVVAPIEFAVLDMPNFTKGDGLLGMNFLQHFQFQINQSAETLSLEPQKD